MWASVSFLERRMFAHVFCYKYSLKPLLDRLAVLSWSRKAISAEEHSWYPRVSELHRILYNFQKLGMYRSYGRF
jgi:hypothetical protein